MYIYICVCVCVCLSVCVFKSRCPLRHRSEVKHLKKELRALHVYYYYPLRPTRMITSPPL